MGDSQHGADCSCIVRRIEFRHVDAQTGANAGAYLCSCLRVYAGVCVSVCLCGLLDAPTALAACCGFDLCYKYIFGIWYFLSVSASVCLYEKLRCGALITVAYET